jgi:TPR repeat protein
MPFSNPSALKERLAEFVKAAEPESIHAYKFMATMYDTLGKRYPEYFEEEFKWVKLCAEGGVAEWQSQLAWYYVTGTVVEQDYLKAAAWLKKASDQGQARATCRLGLLYFLGDGGIPEDYEKALLLIEKAIELGDSSAIRAREVVRRNMSPEQIKEVQEILLKAMEK